MLEIFSPYFGFINFFIIILVNVLLIISKPESWIPYVLGNVVAILVLQFIGLNPIGIFIDLIDWLVTQLGNLIAEFIPQWLRDLLNIGEIDIPSESTGGGGGGMIFR